MDAPGSDDAGPLVRQAADGPRVGLVVAGSRGDAQPFVALAMQLRALGARPVLLTHAEHEPLAQRFGIDFVALPGDPRDLLATRAGLGCSTPRSLAIVGPFARPGGRGHVGRAGGVGVGARRCRPSGVLDAGGGRVPRGGSTGRPAIWGVLQPVTPTSQWPSVLVSPGRDLGPANRASHRLADALAWRMLAPGLQDYRRRVGLPPFSRERAEREVLTLGGWSSLLAPAPPDWPPNVVVTGAWRIPTSEEPELPDEVEEFLAAGAPPVFLGLGSATVAEPREVTRMMLAAARDLGVRVVLSRGGRVWERRVRRSENPTCWWSTRWRTADCSAAARPCCTMPEPAPPTPRWPPACRRCRCRSGATSRSGRRGWRRWGVAPAPVPKRRWSRTRIAQALARATGRTLAAPSGACVCPGGGPLRRRRRGGCQGARVSRRPVAAPRRRRPVTR